MRKTSIALGLAAAIVAGCAARAYKDGHYELPGGIAGCDVRKGYATCYYDMDSHKVYFQERGGGAKPDKNRHAMT